MQLFQYLLTCFPFDVICYLIDDANFIPKILTGEQCKLEINNQVSLPLDEDNTKKENFLFLCPYDTYSRCEGPPKFLENYCTGFALFKLCFYN